MTTSLHVRKQSIYSTCTYRIDHTRTILDVEIVLYTIYPNISIECTTCFDFILIEANYLVYIIYYFDAEIEIQVKQVLKYLFGGKNRQEKAIEKRSEVFSFNTEVKTKTHA